MASFGDRIIGAMKLDAATYEEVEADRTATGQAMAVVILASLSSGLGVMRILGPAGVIGGTLSALVAWFVWALLTYAIGTRILPEPQTEATVGQLLRTTGFAAAPGLIRVLAAIPLLGWLVAIVASVWMLAAMIVAVRQALDYTSTLRAVGVCVIGWLVYLATALLFLPFAR
ncbi:MAG TPA: YIP1 family protein [Vicinamibacterales bacterium]|nr:YIP1 family protein [Vicinamibacterales bacterium]